MRHRYYFLLATLFLLSLTVALSGIYWLLGESRESHRICQENAETIRWNMLEKEAIECIGFPPGDYTSTAHRIPILAPEGLTYMGHRDHARLVERRNQKGSIILQWYGDRGAIIVSVDDKSDGKMRVREVQFLEYVSEEESFVVIALRQLGLVASREQ